MDFRDHQRSLLYSSPKGGSSKGFDYNDIAEWERSASQICGQSVFTKLLGKSPNRHTTGEYLSTQTFSSPPTTKSCLKGSPLYYRRGGGGGYEDLRSSLRSPEDTESSSSSSSKSTEELLHQVESSSRNFNVVQFDASRDENSSNDDENNLLSPTSKDRLSSFLGFRQSPWQSSLPAVTEEPSSFETDDHSHNESVRSGNKETCSTPTKSSSMPRKQPPSSPERNEMLAAMRSLVLKQQAALKEMVKENAKYRSKLSACQSLMIKMKQEQVEREAMLNQIKLEKEAFETEAAWLREEIKTVGHHGDRDDEDGEVQLKLRKLMMGEPFSPSNAADKAAADAFCSFKRSLLPPEERKLGALTSSSPLTLAVKSLDYRKESAWDDDDDDDDDDDVVESRDDERITTTRCTSTLTDCTRETRDEAPLLSPSIIRTEPAALSSVAAAEKKETKPLNIAREEVDMFKQRLLTIQQRRSQRESGRKQKQRTVRFDSVITK